MARIRSIKPGFFLNDELAELPPLDRILFAGLWTLADREGRLEDRIKKIKAEILPYDDHDIDEALERLATKSFIQRYEIKGCKYIQILNFLKHQCPNVKEHASTIPAPCKHSTSTPRLRKGKEQEGNSIGKEQEGKGEEENARAQKLPHGEFQNVLLTVRELEKLQERFGKEKTSTLIERLSSGIASKGYRYSSHYATILNWEKREPAQGKSPPGAPPYGKTAGNKELIERMLAKCEEPNDTG